MSSSIPRLSADEMSPELFSFLAPRVKRLGYLGEFFQCTANQPKALLAFLHFTEELKHALPDNLTEVVAISVATKLDNAYEHVQHERLARKLGFSAEWIRQVGSPDEECPALNSEEQAVRRLAHRSIERRGKDVSKELDAVTAAIGAEKAVAVLLLISRYMAHALIVNALDLAPPPVAVAALAQGN